MAIGFTLFRNWKLC